MRKSVLWLFVLLFCVAGLVAAGGLVSGHTPRASVARAPVVSAFEASSGSWIYSADLNACYPWTGLGLAGWVPVSTCPPGAFRGYLYNPQTFECVTYPTVPASYADPWQWRSACPGPGSESQPCPDPREQTAASVVGIVKADGFSLHDLQEPPVPGTPCQPGAMRFTREGIFLCVDPNVWARTPLLLQ